MNSMLIVFWFFSSIYNVILYWISHAYFNCEFVFKFHTKCIHYKSSKGDIDYLVGPSIEDEMRRENKMIQTKKKSEKEQSDPKRWLCSGSIVKLQSHNRSKKQKQTSGFTWLGIQRKRRRVTGHCLLALGSPGHLSRTLLHVDCLLWMFNDNNR